MREPPSARRLLPCGAWAEPRSRLADGEGQKAMLASSPCFDQAARARAEPVSPEPKSILLTATSSC